MKQPDPVRYQNTRLTMLCGSMPKQRLVNTLMTALSGTRPSQPVEDYSELPEFYIEGVTTRYGDTLRCYLNLCSMETLVILTAIRYDYDASLSDEGIAQDIADRFWAVIGSRVCDGRRQ